MRSNGASSTTFGSIIKSRSSAGVLRNSRLTSITLRPTLLPAPVAPATITCGIDARSAKYGAPMMSRPSTHGSGAFISTKRRSSTSSRRLTGMRCSFGTSKPMRFLPGIGAMMRTLRERPSARSSARPATFETFRAGDGRHLERGDGRPRVDLLDLAGHAIVAQHLLELLRRLLEELAVDLDLVDRRGLEHVGRREAEAAADRRHDAHDLGLLGRERGARVDDLRLVDLGRLDALRRGRGDGHDRRRRRHVGRVDHGRARLVEHGVERGALLSTALRRRLGGGRDGGLERRRIGLAVVGDEARRGRREIGRRDRDGGRRGGLDVVVGERGDDRVTRLVGDDRGLGLLLLDAGALAVDLARGDPRAEQRAHAAEAVLAHDDGAALDAAAPTR